MEELMNRKKTLEAELQRLDNELKQLRSIINQKEADFLITRGRLLEINEQINTKEMI